MKIKVTGYMDTQDMDPKHVDLNHDMGLSSEGFEYYATELSLDDVEFTLLDGMEEGAAPPRGPKKVPEGYVWVEGHWRKP